MVQQNFGWGSVVAFLSSLAQDFIEEASAATAACTNTYS